jgi:hypothetical protein
VFLIIVKKQKIFSREDSTRARVNFSTKKKTETEKRATQQALVMIAGGD